MTSTRQATVRAVTMHKFAIVAVSSVYSQETSGIQSSIEPFGD